HVADQDRVLEDDRHIGAAAVGGDEAVLLVEIMVPNHLARIAVEATEVTADALSIDAACFRVARNARPSDAGVGCVGKIDVESVVPNLLARGRVNADDLLA